jgi:hypothetical protein
MGITTHDILQEDDLVLLANVSIIAWYSLMFDTQVLTSFGLIAVQGVWHPV